MDNKHSFETAICAEYEQLLLNCQNALEIWTERREEAWRSGLRGKELGAELLRLQADFARAYTFLQNHTRICPLCQFASKIAELDPKELLCVASRRTRPC
jgi:hypothetical protein